MKQQTAGSSPSITVGDITIPAEIRFLSVADLRYYKVNPRIFSILKQFGESVTQEQIERQLWDQDATHDLYRDIQQNGGLLEEIVVRDGEVLEGNSRLCAYRYLLKNAKEKGDQNGIEKWTTIRAKILPHDTDDKTVFAILGMLHIRGKAKWIPYEQASYLFRQANAYRMKASELAVQIGLSEADVKNMIEAYKLMEQYNITDTNRFSYFLEFAKSRKLADCKEYVPKGMDLAEKFSEWVRDGKFPRGEAVRDLPTILKDKGARAKFLGGQANFEEALEIARDRHPEATSSFYNKLKRATEAMNDAEPARVQDEVTADAQKKNIIRDLARTAKRFAKSVGVDF
jgi:hypothetical protein